MNKQLEYRNSSSWKAAADHEQIEGYAAVLETPTVLYKDPETGLAYHERIASGAFAGADLSDVTFLVQHQTVPVYARTRGGSLVVSVDSHGLHFSADLSRTEKGKDLYRDIRAGLYDQCSFAFTIAAKHYEAETRTMVIDQIEKVYDCSVCDRGAYPTTEVHARSFESVSQADRAAYVQAEIRRLHDVANADQALGIKDLTAADFVPDQFTGEFNELDKIRRAACELRDAKYTTIPEARTAHVQLQGLQRTLVEAIEKRRALRADVAAGKVISTLHHEFQKRKEREKRNMENEFFVKMIEKRAANNVAGMGNVIPEVIIKGCLRQGANGLLSFISISHISNGGSVKIPYIADSTITVNAHTENAAITPAGTLPSVVTITHSEQEATLGYSYLGTRLGAEELKHILSQGLFKAMDRKLDTLAIGAINALTWSTTAGSANAVQWTTSGAPTLAEVLALMELLPAQYSDEACIFLSRATALAIVKGSTGLIDGNGNTNGMYNINPVTDLDQLFGVPVVIDANVAAGDILYGNPEAVHLNIAGGMMFNDWMDHDSLTEKLQVACAAGAAAEVGSFVKGSNLIA